MTLLDNLYNFHTWLMNSLANTFTEVFSKVGTKCVILVNLFTTINTVLYLFFYSNFVMKSTIIYAYSFFFFFFLSQQFITQDVMAVHAYKRNYIQSINILIFFIQLPNIEDY